jgi:hypothetical protein
MQKILTFMAQSVKRAGTYLPHVTWNPRQANLKTHELTSFAQHMMRQAMDVKYHRHIVCEARHWQMTHYGAQDCHSMFNVDMHYSVIYHGVSQSGKSFMVKDATVGIPSPPPICRSLKLFPKKGQGHDSRHGDDHAGNVETSVQHAR